MICACFFNCTRCLFSLLQAKDEQADAVKKRIRQWESENRVLGHHARSDVHRPRALLVLSGTRVDVCACVRVCINVCVRLCMFQCFRLCACLLDCDLCLCSTAAIARRVPRQC